MSTKPKAEKIKEPVEKAGDIVKQNAWVSILESLSVFVLGILFIIWPEFMVTAITYIVAVFFMVKGGYEIIEYFLEKGQYNFFNNRLFSGVISVLAGIIVLAMGQGIANVFRIILGILMIYESLVRLNTAFKLYQAGVGLWRVITVFALVILVLGIFIFFNDVTTVIGWAMIIAGLIGIIGDVMFISKINTVISKFNSTYDGVASAFQKGK